MIDPRLRAFPFRSWLAERGWLRSGAAVRRVEIAPGTPRRVAPAVHLEDELDRIRGVSEFDTLEMQHRYATTDRDVNGPTCLVEVGEAVVNQEGAFWGRGSCRTTLGRRTMLHRGPLAEVEEAVFCSDWVIRDFFGHWLRDGLAQEMLAGDLGRATVALRPAPWLHEAGYRAAVGLHPDHDGPCHVRRLAIVEDVHFNDHRFARARRLRELFQNGGGRVGRTGWSSWRGARAARRGRWSTRPR